MSFSRNDSWVWDFWLADDGVNFHMFYLFAPKSLVDPHLRHRNARIGRASSTDLTTWQDHGEVLGPGLIGTFDETATWTGSVVRGDDGLWRMFYTGSVFESTTSNRNVESIGVATSADLSSWTKHSDIVIRSDPRWYETLGESEWPEEAWRDPWVFRDPDGDGWHMLITARGKSGAMKQRGVIGHAHSKDLITWEVRPPLSPLSSGYAHLEVPQVTKVDGRHVLIFSAVADVLADPGSHDVGTWLLDDVRELGSYDVRNAVPLTNQRLYSGRIIHDRGGNAVLLAFDPGTEGEDFAGRICDPIPLRRGSDGIVMLAPDGFADSIAMSGRSAESM